MGGYSVYSMSRESLTVELNKGKELFITSMLNEGIINNEQYEQIKNYSIVLGKKGFFGSLWDKLFKKNDEDYYFIVKIIAPKLPTDKIQNEEE